jgi:CubicO group peptidase (beta-lactamase class C family)
VDDTVAEPAAATTGPRPANPAAAAGSRAADLVPLPGQPAGVPWPTDAWPTADPPGSVAAALPALVDDVMSNAHRYGATYAVAIAHRGMLVAERYGGELEHWDRPREQVGPDTRLLSWSMAKSVLHAAVGMLVSEGRLALDAAPPVPEWVDAAGRADPRRAITLEHMLTMRDGLAFAEDYVDAGASDVIEMLFGAGQHDMAHFAADRPLAHPPGTVFNYSSGTSNVVSGIVARTVGPGEPYRRFLQQRLFAPLGMRSADALFDDAGTFVGSSYLYATAQDYLRFGLLYLRDGVWEGTRLLPEGWVDHARRARSHDEEADRWYGAHWWVLGDDLGIFWANGYEEQSIMICPAVDLVVVRLGKSTDDAHPLALRAWRAEVVDAFRSAGS